MQQKTSEQFIKEAKQIHGDKYDYSKVVYINCKTKVCIICPIHGEFWQTPDCHLQGNGCKKCGRIKANQNETNTSEQFIEKAKQIHGDKYDYSKVEYTNAKTKVCIICPIHGEFWQTPSNHIKGQGCPKCKGDLCRKRCLLDKKEFFEKVKKIHNYKYSYNEDVYNGLHSLIEIICPIHGIFKQEANVHLRGGGCPKCSKYRTRYTTETLIETFKKIHGDKYDYSKVEYKTIKEKICIICPKHGEFFQSPEKHLKGHGCPKCKSSHLEEEIRLLLLNNSVNFEEQKKFIWLGKQSLDFYIPSKKIAIECQGLQHFKSIIYIKKTKTDINKQIKLDENKRKLCEEHGIRLLYYSNLNIDYPYKVYENKEEILKIIKNND